MATNYRVDAKQAAIDQWTADPCGPEVAGEPGTRSYFEYLMAQRHEYAPWMIEVLDPEGTRDLDVLDVGCGQGIDVVRYALGGARVTGIDLTPRHVDLARNHLAAMEVGGTILNGDAEHLPFPDGSFDRVSSNGVLHHTPDMSGALREIRRVLRPDGEARLIVYNRSSAYFWITLVLAYGLLRGLLFKDRSLEALASRLVERTSVGARPLVRFYTPARFRDELHAAGFARIRTEVRHFEPSDQFLTKWIRHSGLIRWLDHRCGFYVVAYATP